MHDKGSSTPQKVIKKMTERERNIEKLHREGCKGKAMTREDLKALVERGADVTGVDTSNVTNMRGMLDCCGMSADNYSATLIGWAALARRKGVQRGVILGARGMKYTPEAEEARRVLVEGFGWKITGDERVRP